MPVKDEAEFQHDVMLINVNRTADVLEPYEAVRYSWKISTVNAERVEYILAVRSGTIIGVFEVEEWLPANKRNFPELTDARGNWGRQEGRWGFRGHSGPADVQNLYLHKRVPKRFRGTGNPIRYVFVRNSQTR